MEHFYGHQVARKRTQARIKAYAYLSVYVAVSFYVGIISFVSTSGSIWVQWPVVGLGIAIALHTLSVMALTGRFAVTKAMSEKELCKVQLRSSHG